jgi:hypothetical protein
VLRSGRRVLILGFAAGEVPRLATRLARRASDPDLLSVTAAELARLLESGLRALVSSTVPLSEGPAALGALERRTAIGKIVLSIGPPSQVRQ